MVTNTGLVCFVTPDYVDSSVETLRAELIGLSSICCSGIPFIPQTASVSFNGTSDQYMSSETNVPFGSNVEHTLMIWIKKTGPFTMSGNLYMVYDGSDAHDRTEIYLPDLDDSLKVAAYNDGSSEDPNRHYIEVADFFTGIDNTWVQIVVTVTADEMHLYKNANEVGSSYESITLAAIDRRVGEFGRAFPGLVHSAAFWDTCLSPEEVTAVFNAGNGRDFDLKTDNGDYVSASNLQYWWRTGFNFAVDSMIGLDYADVNPQLNIMDGSSGISRSNIVFDAPVVA